MNNPTNEMSLRIARTALAVIFAALALSAGPVFADDLDLANADAPLVNIDRWKQALAGYDPVAYFDYGEATKGVRQFYTTHNGVHYMFASKVTHKKFVSSPDDYLPRFGGYCALSLALADGELPERSPGLYPSDPTLFKVIDGKLYLFSSDLGVDAIERWNENESEYLARAEANWNAIVESRK